MNGLTHGMEEIAFSLESGVPFAFNVQDYKKVQNVQLVQTAQHVKEKTIKLQMQRRTALVSGRHLF